LKKTRSRGIQVFIIYEDKNLGLDLFGGVLLLLEWGWQGLRLFKEFLSKIYWAQRGLIKNEVNMIS